MPEQIAGNSTFLYLVLGLSAGILGATFGVGGGILMVPVLTIVAAMPQKEAQGISLSVMIFLAITASIRYQLNPDINIDWRIVAIMSVTMIIGANIGSTVASHLSTKYLQIGFAILLFAAGIRMIMSALKPVS